MNILKMTHRDAVLEFGRDPSETSVITCSAITTAQQSERPSTAVVDADLDDRCSSPAQTHNALPLKTRFIASVVQDNKDDSGLTTKHHDSRLDETAQHAVFLTPILSQSRLKNPTAQHIDAHDLFFPHNMTSDTYPMLHLASEFVVPHRQLDNSLISPDTRIIFGSKSFSDTPHIVITPPQYTPGQEFVAQENVVGWQLPGHLMVPLLDFVTGRLYSPVHLPETCTLSPHAVGIPSINRADTFPSPMRAVPQARYHTRLFRASPFIDPILSFCRERLTMFHVVSALQKHQCKAAAYAASHLASTYRIRYDSPHFRWTFERPYQWSDPAEALVESARTLGGGVIIESPCPFTSPHIIITRPPPENQWIAWANATNDPQDSNYLTVPSLLVRMINEPDDNDSASSPSESITDLTGCLSRPDTPAPMTPNDENKTFCFDRDAAKRYRMGDDALMDETSDMILEEVEEATCHSYKSNLATSLPPVSLSPCIYYDDDEDDDLPPFDDWYQDVARRAQIAF